MDDTRHFHVQTCMNTDLNLIELTDDQDHQMPSPNLLHVHVALFIAAR